MTNTEQSLRECLQDLVEHYSWYAGPYDPVWDEITKARSLLSRPPTEGIGWTDADLEAAWKESHRLSESSYWDFKGWLTNYKISKK